MINIIIGILFRVLTCSLSRSHPNPPCAIRKCTYKRTYSHSVPQKKAKRRRRKKKKRRVYQFIDLWAAMVKQCKQRQQHNNISIKALRPKVYITDSSSFKSLVQRLTGNANTPPPPPLPTLLDSSFDQFLVSQNEQQLFNQLPFLQTMDETSCSHLSFFHYQQQGLSDIQCSVPFHDDNNLVRQDISIYDYEISGLI